MIAEDVKVLLQMGLNRRKNSILIWDQTLMEALNMVLSDIYSLTWAYRGFQVRQETIAGWETSHTASRPILRVLSLKDGDGVVDRFTNTRIESELAQGEYTQLPWSKNIAVYPNTNWYTLTYIAWYNEVTDLSQELDLPHLFKNVIYSLMLSYLYPLHGQAQESKEAVMYNRAVAQLDWLKTILTLPINSFSHNAK
jgi:hypothetical protein